MCIHLFVLDDVWFMQVLQSDTVFKAGTLQMLFQIVCIDMWQIVMIWEANVTWGLCKNASNGKLNGWLNILKFLNNSYILRGEKQRNTSSSDSNKIQLLFLLNKSVRVAQFSVKDNHYILSQISFIQKLPIRVLVQFVKWSKQQKRV